MRSTIIVVLLVAAFLMSACGGNAAPSANLSHTSSSTPTMSVNDVVATKLVQTQTAVAQAGATATIQAAVQQAVEATRDKALLSKSLRIPGLVSVSYPNTWKVKPYGEYAVAESLGEFDYWILIGHSTEIPAGESLIGFMREHIVGSKDLEQIEVGGEEALLVKDVGGVRSTSGRQGTAIVAVILLPNDNRIVEIVIGTTNPSISAEFEHLAMTMLETVRWER